MQHTVQLWHFYVKFVGMRNLIIITSVVFIAIVITSYLYFSNLRKDEPPGQENTEIAGEEITSADRATGYAAPLWTFDLNAEPVSKPIVCIFDDRQRFVLIQDAYHILYAISASGEKLWNAQLPGAIVGNIHQLSDSSLLFTTAERLYRIDTAGDPLPGFSLRLSQKATGRGATPSYENTEDIRIEVEAGNRILSFDHRGRQLQSRSIRADEASNATVGDQEMPDSTDVTLATDCGPLFFYGPLSEKEGNYLLCGKDDGKLYCYRYE